jgi:hypothetical protein
VLDRLIGAAGDLRGRRRDEAWSERDPAEERERERRACDRELHVRDLHVGSFPFAFCRHPENASATAR